MKYEQYFKNYLAKIEETLQSFLPLEKQPNSVLYEAMHYAVFPGGKRFRPILAMAAAEACGGKWQDALIPAASLELIHSYSLVHDDLPALDNDEMRRGKLTCHKKYGEAMAILAGDALLTLAMQILSRVQPPGKAVALLAEISTASGTYGMIGGQVADLMTAPENLNQLMLDFINIHKTGKLIKASTVCGAIAAGASKDQIIHMQRYGESIGLSFQLIDDLLDQDGYCKLTKPREIRHKTRDLIAIAKREVKPFGKKADKLIALADYLLKRMPRGNHVEVDS